MIYNNATDLFRDKFNKEELVPLYRELQNRDINPEIWDKQIKYWSAFISKWGSQFNVVDFSINQLTQSLEFKDVFPNIQPSIDNLIKLNVLISRDSFLNKKKSFIKSFASKLFGFVNPSDQQECDIFIFTNNLKLLVKQIISEVENQEVSSIDAVLTNGEIKNKYCNNVDFDYIKITLEGTKGVKAYKNGFYFQTGNYSSLSDDIVEAILNSKITLRGINKRLNDIENEINNEIAKAREYKSKKQKAKAISCLRKKKVLETQEINIRKLHDELTHILSMLSENELNKNILNCMKQASINSKKIKMPTIEDIDKIKDDIEAHKEMTDEITDALGNIGSQIDDSEIEKEFDELLNDDEPAQEHFETIGTFKYKPIKDKQYTS